MGLKYVPHAYMERAVWNINYFLKYDEDDNLRYQGEENHNYLVKITLHFFMFLFIITLVQTSWVLEFLIVSYMGRHISVILLSILAHSVIISIIYVCTGASSENLD